MCRPLDPISTRRPGVAAIPLPLSDGADWWFASPIERFRPVFDGQGRVVGIAHHAGPSITARRRLESLGLAIESGDEGRAREAMIDLATELLSTSHDIEPDPARTLIARSLDDDPERIDYILAIALGEPTATGEPAR